MKMNHTAEQQREALSCPQPEQNHEKKGGCSFAAKWAALWMDRRAFRDRAIPALLCAFACAFTFFVFGPYELYISNIDYYSFSFRSLILPMALTGLFVFVLTGGALLLLRGKLYNGALAVLLWCTLFGYLQGNVFNTDHGSLDGSAIEWSLFGSTVLLNLLIWIAGLLVIFAVLYFSRRVFAIGVQIISIVLIGAQLVALGIMVSTTDLSKNTDVGYLSASSIYEVSPDRNVIVFLLDRFDTIYAEEQIARDENVKASLDGFTYYKNFTGSYSRTFPAVNYLLTGVKTDYSIPYDEYVGQAWSESSFLPSIRQAGYLSKLYTEPSYTFLSFDNIKGAVDNIGERPRDVDVPLMIKYMVQLSAYRYAPESLKPFCWIYTDQLQDIATLDAEDHDEIYWIDDIAFHDNLEQDGLTVNEQSKGSFIFYHLQGSHDPYIMDENWQRTTFPTLEEGIYRQTKGNLRTVFRYCEMLKERGLYDKTTIIITADHGRTGTVPVLDYSRVLSLLIKPAGADPDTPLAFSNKQICQDNLRASILSYFGLPVEDGTRTIESIGEDEEVVRYFYMSGSNELQTKRDVSLVTYEITGDANNFSNWKIVSNEKMLYPYYDANKS